MTKFGIHTLSDSNKAQSCLGCDDYLFFLVTTAIDLDATSLLPGSSIHVGVNWTLDPGK